MPVIKFIKEKKEIEVPDGANLREEAIKAGINVYRAQRHRRRINKYLNCHGLGQCGTCRVKITKGMENTSPMGWRAEKVPRAGSDAADAAGLDPLPCLAFVGNEETMRLACQTLVQRRHRSRDGAADRSVWREFL